ncbi:uncharacterized protein LOC133173334 [Saccostrea echinata]|uniref:uncharacterized protein LOC133173334 n=1 Tax=Saccostrea echinata TaxID=191078 RepID=UPI002A820D89|nr:uncharacterized protein LOC133173334 [Saccostrea echinata]
MAAGHGNIKIIDSDSENGSDSEENNVVQRTEDTSNEIDDEETLYEEVIITRQQDNTLPEQHNNTTEKIIKCKTKHHCLLMKMASVGSDVSNLRVSFSEENCAITLQGPKELVLERNVYYLQRLNLVCTSSEPVSANRLTILQRDGCIEKLRQRGMVAGQTFCVFIEENQNPTDPALHCLAFSEKEAKEALQNSLGCFQKINVPFASHNVELFMTRTWDEETQSLQKSLMVVIEIVHTQSVVEVEGLTEDVHKAADKLRDVFEAHRPVRNIILRGAKARLICKTHNLKEELTRLKEEAKQKQETIDVTETHADHEDTLTIKFTDDHSLRTRIQKLIDQIKDLELTLADLNKNDQGIITRCLNSERGKRELRNLEEKYDVFIDIVDSDKTIEVRYIEDNSSSLSAMTRSKSLSNLSEEKKSLTVGSTELLVKDGSVVKEKASVLVNVLRKSSMWKYGRLPRMFSSASRQLRDDFEEDYDGEENVILIQSSERLTHLCDFVCNIVLEDWNRNDSKSHEQRLREVIKKCLRHCEDNQVDSIAFPPVGTGKLLKFPDDMVAKIMMEECVNWTKGRTRLRKIVFVIHDTGERQSFEEELGRFHGILSKKSKLQRLGTLLPVFRRRGSPTSQQEAKQSESVQSVTLSLPYLLLSGENSQRLNDSRKKITEEMERLFLSKEIIQNKGLNKISWDDKQDIFELVRTMDVILIIDSDKYVISGHRDDVQALANKIRALLLDSFSVESLESSSQTKPKRWMGPRSKKGTEDYWREVLEHQKTPLYWKEFRGGYDIKYYLKQHKKDYCRVNPVDSDTFKAISEMVEQTWDQTLVGHGADARSLSHQGIKVTNIERVESIELFSHYSQQRERIIRQMLRSGLNSYPRIETVTQKGGLLTTLKMPKLLNTSLYLDINEHYLFHGTKSSFIENITKKGIDPRKSSDRLLFGQGIYCGESSTKADQYTDDKTNRQQTNLKMLMVRLLIGNPFVSGKEHPYKHPPCSSCKTTNCLVGEHCHYDSIIVEGRWIFREFVVYEPNQCYPEYIITYDRV